MTDRQPQDWFERFDDSQAEQIVGDMLDLAELAFHYGQVKRAPEFPNGEREDDVRHTFTLQLVAVALATEYFPNLDPGEVALLSMVHDLPELLTKDETTFNMDTAGRQAKHTRETASIDFLRDHQLREWMGVMDIVDRYETQDSPEARFVRLVDKIMPGLSNLLNQGMTLRGFYGVTHVSEVQDSIENTNQHMAEYIEAMPCVAQLRDTVNRFIQTDLFYDDGRIKPAPSSYDTYFGQQLFDDRHYVRSLGNPEAEETT